MYYILGLGNPGEKYDNTPHNVGRDICRKLAKRFQCSSDYIDKTRRALIYRCGDFEIILPETYMNRSGDVLRESLQDDPDIATKIIVIHDDIDLPFGALKIVQAKGAGGHRGVSSIQQTLGTNEFIRFRIGVAPVDESGEMRKPRGKEAVTAYVLRPWSTARGSHLYQELLPRIEKAIKCIADEGVEKAMSLYNYEEPQK